MYVCTNCGKATANPANFCDVCGAPLAVQPDPQPQYYQPQPQYYQPKPVEPPMPSKGKSIAGMAIGIAGFVFGTLGMLVLFFVLLALGVADGYQAEASIGFIGWFYCFAFGIESLPLSIVGMCLGNSSIRDGCTLRTASLAKTFGKIGTIFGSILLGFAFIFLAIFAGGL